MWIKRSLEFSKRNSNSRFFACYLAGDTPILISGIVLPYVCQRADIAFVCRLECVPCGTCEYIPAMMCSSQRHLTSWPPEDASEAQLTDLQFTPGTVKENP